MRTKTFELLMKHHRPTEEQKTAVKGHSSQSQNITIEPLRLLHISHVNDYNLSVSTNKSEPRQPNRHLIEELEVQNFRLIEENMKILDYEKAFIQSIRQDVLKVVHKIQDFRYMEAVKKLHQMLAELELREKEGVESQVAMRTEMKILGGSPYHKRYIAQKKKNLTLKPRVYQHYVQFPLTAVQEIIDNGSAKKQDSEFLDEITSIRSPVRSQADLQYMLLLQGHSIESLLSEKQQSC